MAGGENENEIERGERQAAEREKGGDGGREGARERERERERKKDREREREREREPAYVQASTCHPAAQPRLRAWAAGTEGLDYCESAP